MGALFRIGTATAGPVRTNAVPQLAAYRIRFDSNGVVGAGAAGSLWGMEYHVTHACGHARTHYLSGHVNQRERKARWLATTDCRGCFLAARQASDAQAAASDGAAIARLSLGDLVGSERQVAWATTIRARRLAALVRDGRISEDPHHACLAISEAKWWIDRRDAGDDALLDQAVVTATAGTVTEVFRPAD